MATSSLWLPLEARQEGKLFIGDVFASIAPTEAVGGFSMLGYPDEVASFFTNMTREGTDGATTVLTVGPAIPVGRKVIIVAYSEASKVASSVADSQANTWVVDHTGNGGSGTAFFSIISCQVTTEIAAAGTVTITWSAATSAISKVVMFSVAELPSSSAFDQAVVAQQGAGVVHPMGPSRACAGITSFVVVAQFAAVPTADPISLDATFTVPLSSALLIGDMQVAHKRVKKDDPVSSTIEYDESTGTISVQAIYRSNPIASVTWAPLSERRFPVSVSGHEVKFLGFSHLEDRHLRYTFPMPENYLSGGTVKLWWTSELLTGDCRWGGRIAAITAGDVDTIVEKNLAAPTLVDSPTNTTEARRVNQTSIVLANLDSVAANDVVKLKVHRDATHANDTLKAEAELICVHFTYTS